MPPTREVTSQKMIAGDEGAPLAGSLSSARAILIISKHKAARLYWPALLGKKFRRGTGGGGINSLLNYCYAVLRSSVARSLSAAGLHPALGVHHKNRNNAFCLADDPIEPYRPFADYLVARLSKGIDGKIDELTPDIKRQLASVLELYVQGQRGLAPISNAISASALSLRDSFATGKNGIWRPDFERKVLEHNSTAFILFYLSII